MPERFLHFSGLGPDEQSWYYNCRGGQVPVFLGDWVRLDPDKHPEIAYIIESGAAMLLDSAPENADILDEETNPNPRLRRIISRGGKRKIRQGPGLPEVLALTPDDIERAMLLFLSQEPSEYFGCEHVDATEVVRHRARRAVRLPAFLYPNLIVLHRLAWLRCRVERLQSNRLAKSIKAQRRQFVEDHHLEWGEDRSVLRGRAETYFPSPNRSRLTIGGVLRRWGVTETDRAPSASTLYRYQQGLGLERAHIDLLIQRALEGDRPFLLLGRIGAGFQTISIGPYVPGAQASRLTTAYDLDGAIAWVELSEDRSRAVVHFFGLKAPPTLHS